MKTIALLHEKDTHVVDHLAKCISAMVHLSRGRQPAAAVGRRTPRRAARCLAVFGGVLFAVTCTHRCAFVTGGARVASALAPSTAIKSQKRLQGVQFQGQDAGGSLENRHGHGIDRNLAQAPWWNNIDQLETLKLENVQRICAPSLVGHRQQQAAVVRGALEDKWLGAEGRVMESISNTTLSLFTAGHDGQNTFSRGLHRNLRSLVQPSTALWRQLVSSKQAWAMRGELELNPADLADLFGGSSADIREAMVEGRAAVSLFSGAGGTRTPLHVDNIHALIYQVEGTKRLFMSSRPDIADAVGRGAIPEEVLHDGSTDVFCVDGSLEEVHGLCEPKPPRAHGAFVELHPGDCLILPAGLYHDVEAAADAPASLSLTVRFDSSMIAQGSPSDFGEVLKQYGLPALAFHFVLWMSTIALTYVAFSLCGSDAHTLLRYFPASFAQRIGDGLVIDPLTRAMCTADALSPWRMALTLCVAPFLARIGQNLQWYGLAEDVIWSIDDSLNGSLREQARAAASLASRLTR